MARILVTGGTGFIGRAVVEQLCQEGHHVVIISRTDRSNDDTLNVQYRKWPADMSTVYEVFGALDVIINLAGDPINKGRWTATKKLRILESRVQVTSKVMECIEHLPTKPQLLINASAIGYYGFSDERQFHEADHITPHNFLTEVSDAWERQAKRAEAFGVRVVVARLGIVLGRDGGALTPMVMPYRWFAGGTVASGKQWLSWIHMADVVGLIIWIMAHPEIEGPVNFTAPQPMRMKPFGQAIAKVLHRPHWMPVPAFALRIIFGEMGDLLIKGQHVTPQVALSNGYRFQFSEVEPALRDLLT